MLVSRAKEMLLSRCIALASLSLLGKVDGRECYLSDAPDCTPPPVTVLISDCFLSDTPDCFLIEQMPTPCSQLLIVLLSATSDSARNGTSASNARGW